MPAVTIATLKRFTDEQLYSLELAHRRIHLHTPEPAPRSRWAPPAKDGEQGPEPPFQVVFRTPNEGEYDHFVGSANEAGTRGRAQRDLAKATIVAISWRGEQTMLENSSDAAGKKAIRALWDKLRADWPGIPEAVAAKLTEMAGVAKDEGEKE